MVSKSKVEAYFNYFKENNLLFKYQTLDLQRIDNWIEQLRSTQEHENHENNIDPIEDKFDEGRSHIPMETPYNMSDVEKFVRFENDSGENNCWIMLLINSLSNNYFLHCHFQNVQTFLHLTYCMVFPLEYGFYLHQICLLWDLYYFHDFHVLELISVVQSNYQSFAYPKSDL